jgi:hypothetical protein
MMNTDSKLETLMEYHNSNFFVGVGGSSGSGAPGATSGLREQGTRVSKNCFANYV